MFFFSLTNISNKSISLIFFWFNPPSIEYINPLLESSFFYSLLFAIFRLVFAAFRRKPPPLYTSNASSETFRLSHIPLRKLQRRFALALTLTLLFHDFFSYNLIYLIFFFLTFRFNNSSVTVAPSVHRATFLLSSRLPQR